MNEEEDYLPESVCSWCGGNLSDMMEMEGFSFDTALEVHVEDCDIYLAEPGPRNEDGF